MCESAGPGFVSTSPARRIFKFFSIAKCLRFFVPLIAVITLSSVRQIYRCREQLYIFLLTWNIRWIGNGVRIECVTLGFLIDLQQSFRFFVALISGVLVLESVSGSLDRLREFSFSESLLLVPEDLQVEYSAWAWAWDSNWVPATGRVLEFFACSWVETF